MQPDCRKSEIKAPFYFGGRIKPTSISEWSQIRKAGTNGLFLVIMAITWMPQAIASFPPCSRHRVELLAILEALLCDVEWVLEAICDLKKGESEGVKPCVGKKRKPDILDESKAPS